MRENSEMSAPGGRIDKQSEHGANVVGHASNGEWDPIVTGRASRTGMSKKKSAGQDDDNEPMVNHGPGPELSDDEYDDAHDAGLIASDEEWENGWEPDEERPPLHAGQDKRRSVAPPAAPAGLDLPPLPPYTLGDDVHQVWTKWLQLAETQEQARYISGEFYRACSPTIRKVTATMGMRWSKSLGRDQHLIESAVGEAFVELCRDIVGGLDVANFHGLLTRRVNQKLYKENLSVKAAGATQATGILQRTQSILVARDQLIAEARAKVLTEQLGGTEEPLTLDEQVRADLSVVPDEPTPQEVIDRVNNVLVRNYADPAKAGVEVTMKDYERAVHTGATSTSTPYDHDTLGGLSYSTSEAVTPAVDADDEISTRELMDIVIRDVLEEARVTNATLYEVCMFYFTTFRETDAPPTGQEIAARMHRSAAWVTPKVKKIREMFARAWAANGAPDLG